MDAVLDGSVQKISDRIRVTVRLIRTKDAASMWAETFDEKWTGRTQRAELNRTENGRSISAAADR